MRWVWFLIFSVMMSSAWASADLQRQELKKANKLYGQKQWDSAIESYLNALEYPQHTDVIQYDLGSAYYKKGDHGQAIEHFKKVEAPKNKELNFRSHYNLGNALYKQGRSLENKDLDEAVRSLQQSLGAYDNALNVRPKDEDAQFNRSFVEKELERLKKKKQEQDKKQDKQEQKDQKKNDKQDQQQNQDPSEEMKEQEQEQKKKEEQRQKEEEGQEDKDKQEQEQKEKQEDKGSQQKQDSKEQGADDKEGEEAKSVEEKQAVAYLEQYEREEAPRGLINFTPRKQKDEYVGKDW